MSSPKSCEYGSLRCRHSVENAGEGASKCTFCKLSPGNENVSTHHWTPLPEYKREQHPLIRLEKLNKARAIQKERNTKRLSKDRGRRSILTRAAKAEKSTEKSFIKATKNSGRSNKDGDHVLAGYITLDTKQQSNNINPVVSMSELAKVKKDSRRAGTLLGALVLRNKFDVGTVVLAEEDFAKLIKQLEPKVDNESDPS